MQLSHFNIHGCIACARSGCVQARVQGAQQEARDAREARQGVMFGTPNARYFDTATNKKGAAAGGGGSAAGVYEDCQPGVTSPELAEALGQWQ